MKTFFESILIIALMSGCSTLTAPIKDDCAAWCKETCYMHLDPKFEGPLYCSGNVMTDKGMIDCNCKGSEAIP